MAGKTIQKLDNGQLLINQPETALVYPTTNELSGNDGVEFKYFLSNIEQVEPNAENSVKHSAGVLKYFSGNKFSQIATDIYKVIYYSKEDNFLLYTVLNDIPTGRVSLPALQLLPSSLQSLRKALPCPAVL